MIQQVKSPVVFIIYNRPDTTQKVFEKISRFKPSTLLVIADGPRPDRREDRDLCVKTRSIIDGINWKCTLLKNFSDQNLGCKDRVSSGLTWAFKQVEEAIILEDDVLPSDSFFPYCDELLDKYRNDTRLMMISGTQFYPANIRGGYSYCFSKWSQIWGWASWRRAWNTYDAGLSSWPLFKSEGQLKNAGLDLKSCMYWTRILDKMHRGAVDTWDHQWSFNMLSHGGLAIQPKINLITNIGFGTGATHTKVVNRYANMRREELNFPLKHPVFVLPDKSIDQAIKKRTQGFLYKIFNSTRVFFASRLLGR
ncbi:MAG: hypothetical protein A2583_00755 [Bdellovibrionales bacterium RIFOXYD1_FULL_53_11]|nr:MAG: hypothetical protein A2583_00755 [Bdellovibrionales bacterium RIFOXYD1_FULL_53_11]